MSIQTQNHHKVASDGDKVIVCVLASVLKQDSNTQKVQKNIIY